VLLSRGELSLSGRLFLQLTVKLFEHVFHEVGVHEVLVGPQRFNLVERRFIVLAAGYSPDFPVESFWDRDSSSAFRASSILALTAASTFSQLPKGPAKFTSKANESHWNISQ